MEERIEKVINELKENDHVTLIRKSKIDGYVDYMSGFVKQVSPKTILVNIGVINKLVKKNAIIEITQRSFINRRLTMTY